AMTDPEGIAATALRLKDEGNVAYKENKYHKAIKLYTESLKLEKSHIVYGNRAQSYMNIEQFELALRDLNEAVVMNPKFTKNTNRRSKVLAHLGMYADARLDNETSLRYSPKDKSALAEALGLKGKENARYMAVKQWNSGEEFEEDEMISIPIADLDLASPIPTTVPQPVIEDTVSPPTDTVPAADVDTTAEEDAVAPAELAPVEDTVSTEEKKEEEIVEATASEEVIVPSETVVVAPTSVTTVRPTSPTKSTASTTVSPSDDATFVSAPEPDRTASRASWMDVKDESFSSISDLHSSIGGKSEDGYTTSPTSPNDTVDDEENEDKRGDEEGARKDSSSDSSSTSTVPSEAEVTNEESTVVEEDTVVDKKEDTVSEKNEEEEEVATVFKKNEEPTVFENKSEPTEVIVVEEKEDTVVTTPIVIPPPATKYLDFVDHFDRLKHHPEAFGKYFLTIDPSSLFPIFSNLIQLDHVTAIIDGLTSTANQDMADLALISSVLHSVSLLPRFDLVVLFMKDADRAKAISLIDLLPSTAKTAQIRQNFV
ncbi:hypothetical protein PENTCL1PPCAC_18847, partial [Pristionchus entomophagus]